MNRLLLAALLWLATLPAALPVFAQAGQQADDVGPGGCGGR